MTTFFEDICSFIGFGEEDSRLLAELRPRIRDRFPKFSEHFYECILRHPEAKVVIRGGAGQVNRLKRTLVDWMESGLEGPHDESFFERRLRIGEVHVVIDLPQRYMFTAINVIRVDYRDAVEDVYEDPRLRHRVNVALDRLFDIELAIMLHSYARDSELKMRRQERLATIGQLAAGIGHDLRNPLATIDSSIYLLRRSLSGEPGAERHLEKIGRQVRSCTDIINNLLGLARSGQPATSLISAAEMLAETRRDLELPPGIHLHVESDDDLQLMADPSLLRQAVTNLLNNAVQALQKKEGNIQLSARRVEPDFAEIAVEDDGPGFPEGLLHRAFEPLVTSKANGIGLGLALVKKIVEELGGTVHAANRDSGGAAIRIRLPIPKADAENDANGESP